MSIEAHRYDYVPPPLTLDEGYWSALLDEGEHTATSHYHEELATPPIRYDDDIEDR